MNAKAWFCGLLFLGLLACVEQPQGYCQVAQQRGEAHFVVYSPMTSMEGNACGEELLTTERIGFQTYQLPGHDKIDIAWRTDTLQRRFDEARAKARWDYKTAQEESLKLNVLADYSSKPDPENRCYVFDNSNPADSRSLKFSAEFEALEFEVEDKAGGTKLDRIPAVTYHYDWRDVVVYSMPASPGQLIEGEVTFRKEEEGAKHCEGSYRFVGLWPAHPCKTSADCNPSVDGQKGAPINPGFAGSLMCHHAGYCTVTRSPEELIRRLSK